MDAAETVEADDGATGVEPRRALRVQDATLVTILALVMLAWLVLLVYGLVLLFR
jgi:hypothetical protein